MSRRDDVAAPAGDGESMRRRYRYSHEIEIGWSVQDDWERCLVEPWVERKARRARERAEAAARLTEADDA